jgi:hypothetical protein
MYPKNVIESPKFKMIETTIIFKDVKKNSEDLYANHKHHIPVIAFILGLSFDALTLQAFDSWITLSKHALFLIVITGLLIVEFLESEERLEPKKKLGKIWIYHEELVHFLFGSLLSAFSVFYFKSSSLMTSFVFMGVILLFLVLNELPKFRHYGILMRSALLTLCLASYAIYSVPIAFGEIGVAPFLTSIGVTAFYLLVIWFGVLKKFGVGESAKKMILLPGAVVLTVFTGMYFLQIIPPVPLSLKFIGIYHKVERLPDGYMVHHERPWWKIWHNGDQDFVFRDGDKIYSYFSVVSPGGFSDRLKVRWLFSIDGEWKSTDAIPVSVHGGRQEGYRGYTHKSHYEAGNWQVRIETSDEREIGRIYFEVLKSETPGERVFIEQEI